MGPDIAGVRTEAIIARWEAIGQPALEDPGASPLFRPGAPVRDLRTWVERRDPSQLELCYLAQQMWPEILHMLDEVRSPASSRRLAYEELKQHLVELEEKRKG